jgi:ornithine carbamoyltransferase
VSSVVDLRGRHPLTVNDYSREEIVYLIDLAAELKAAKHEGREEQQPAGRVIAAVLNDQWHAIQLLADFLTFDEHVSRPLDEVSFCYLGDASVTMADTYLIGGAKLGMDVRIASPRSLWPAEEELHLARRIAVVSDAQIMVTEDVEEAVKGCDVLLLLPDQVNARTMKLTGNPDVKFMYCLPAFHNPDTAIGKELSKQYGVNALEVTDEVLDSPASLVFDQAENRVHMIKAVLVATLRR